MLLDTVTLLAPDNSSVDLWATTPPSVSSLEYVLYEMDLAGPEYQADVVQRPVTPGAYEPRPRAASRTVRLSGVIIGPDRTTVATRARALTQLVARFGDPRHEVRIRYVRDGVTVELTGKLVGRPTVRPSEQAPGSWMDFDLEFVCADPLAYSTSATTVSLTASPGTTTTNPGELVWPTFTVAGPTSGTTTEVTVGNSTTGDRVKLTSLSLSAGQTLTVVCAPGEEHVDIDGAGQLDRIDDLSVFPHVRPGDNDLYVETVGGHDGATGTYAPGWVD